MKPVICNYYLTYRCNARCDFCTIWSNTDVPASQEASPDMVGANLDDARRAGVKIVDFTGGEPLLYDGLPGVLVRAKETGLKTTVTTNGILYPVRANELAGLVDILQFSIDGASAAAHDEVKGEGSFDSVMESVESARNLGERPTLIHTVTDGNLPSVPGVIALAETLRIPLFLNPCFSYTGTEGLSREGAAELMKLSRGKWVTLDRGYMKFIIDGGNRRDRPRCKAVSSTIVISPDDRLILPCFHFQMKALPIRGNLSELLHSPEVEKARKEEGTHPFCEGCTVYCYIRASLFRRPDRYFLPSIGSALKYLYVLNRAPRSN